MEKQKKEHEHAEKMAASEREHTGKKEKEKSDQLKPVLEGITKMMAEQAEAMKLLAEAVAPMSVEKKKESTIVKVGSGYKMTTTEHSVQ